MSVLTRVGIAIILMMLVTIVLAIIENKTEDLLAIIFIAILGVTFMIDGYRRNKMRRQVE